MVYRRSLLGLLLGLWWLASGTSARRQVLMLSFDGFRWDYTDSYYLPSFEELKKGGVYAKTGMRAAFITKTLPDHFTIATGLYEERHGIVGNQMYDPDFDASFNFSVTDGKWWDGGEPIWTTAKLRGLRSASYFWPGSVVELKGVLPDYSPPYNESVPFEQRMDEMVDWLEDKIDIVLGYFNEPDSAGHRYGLMSRGLSDTLKAVDKLLGYLLKKLKEKGLFDNIDILIVSDHGMTNIALEDKDIIVLSDYLDMDEDVERVVMVGPVASIMPKDGRKQVVYDKLKNVKHATVYKKEDIPDRFHYKHHRRIMDIQVFADEGFYILENLEDKPKTMVGNHGYDNRLSSMKPIFIARGPDFKKNHPFEEFDTVNIYPLLCHLLDIEPAPNDGKLANVMGMLSGSTTVQISGLVLILQGVGTLLRHFSL